MTSNTYAPPKFYKKPRVGGVGLRIVSYVVLALSALCVLVPFYIIFVTSFKEQMEAIAIPFTIWPKVFTLEGYRTVLFNDMSGGGIGVSTVLLGFWNTF